MGNLKNFIDILSGHFDNSTQLEKMKEKGIHDYPYAEHVNHIVNDKIRGLPANFEGIFLLEESYYTIGEDTNLLPHLFLFTEEGESIKLSSYDIPEGYDKESFSYENLKTVAFKDLKPSEKFNPAIYNKQGEIWVGGSESMFTPDLEFKLHQRLSAEKLVVSEVMEKKGKRIFGFDDPIIYRRK